MFSLNAGNMDNMKTKKYFHVLIPHYQQLIVFMKKRYLKKRVKGLHISNYPFIFAPRLRDNATEKEGSLGEWLKPPVC